MTNFTIVATSATRGSQDAEFDIHVDDFDSEAEVMGYTRRMAEEMFRLAPQLDLDFDYSNVSVFEGDVGDDEELDSNHPTFAGMWFFADDGAGWASADTLREQADQDNG